MALGLEVRMGASAMTFWQALGSSELSMAYIAKNPPELGPKPR